MVEVMGTVGEEGVSEQREDESPPESKRLTTAMAEMVSEIDFKSGS